MTPLVLCAGATDARGRRTQSYWGAWEQIMTPLGILLKLGMRAGAVLRVAGVLGKLMMTPFVFLAGARGARWRRPHRYTVA